jgi:hypothetical protein
MKDLAVHQLVHNFQIFVIPMVSPEAVFQKKAKVRTFDQEEPMLSGVDRKQLNFPKEKLVRMDFGVRNFRMVDVQNPKCFETNGALFLSQLMQRHLFTAILDLKEGEDNKIVYPYGFLAAKNKGKHIFVDFGFWIFEVTKR